MKCSRVIPLLLFTIILSGCYAAGHHSSPWEWGGGARLAPGFPVGTSGVTVHPMVGYTYLHFDGGHDALWEGGGQLRKPLSSRPGSVWLGIEAAISHLNTVVDGQGYSFSEGTGGYSVTGLIGKPVGQSKWGVNLFGGAGMSHYGDSGVNVRVGFDLQPWFLRR